MQTIQVGKILKLFISKKGVKHRISKESITLTQDGVYEDKFYAQDIDRSVLLVSKESYDLAKDNGIVLHAGQLGENIIMDYNPYALKVGQQLKIGSTLLEISQPCTICKGLTKIDNKLPKLLKEDRGIFAKVIEGGKIKVYDTIYLKC